ncbi:MAG: class I adenylate-forming enzyme family protein [Promethearchaeota archaeon]
MNNFRNLNEVLDEKARDLGDKVFIKYEDKTLTYAAFHEAVLKLANVFTSLGAKKGDFIGIQMTNSIEFCTSIYACWRIGAIATPLISLWKTKEVAEAIKRAQLEIMLVKETIENIIKKANKLDIVKSIVVIGDKKFDELEKVKGNFWDLIDKADATDPKVDIAPGDLASCHFTSGTTGKSKGVLHDHIGYLVAGRVHTNTFNLTSEEYIELVLPMYHIFGFVNLASSVYNGGTIRMLDKFDPNKLLEAFEDPELTLFCGVPSIYKMLVRTLEDGATCNLSKKNRLFISGAGALPPITEEKLNTLLLKGQGSTCQAYGGTEDICVGTANSAKPVPGAIGLPMDGVDLEIVDDDGNILPFGKENIGMIVNHGPHIMLGYLGDPKADDIIDHELSDPVLKPIKGREGIWYWSGDIGYRDEEGVFYLTDRAKDIAKVSERLVYPSETEACLLKHPGVEDVAVIAVPDDIWGEALLAVVIPRADWKGKEEQLEQELIEFGTKELAKYKVPRPGRYWFKNQILTNSLGKVLKREYKEKYIKQLAREKKKGA